MATAQQLQIGRLGLNSIFMDDPATFEWSHDGDQRILTISGDFAGTTLSHTRYMRDQLADTFGLRDDPIAVTWTGDADVDGYYHVLDGTCTMLTQTGNGYIQWTMTLRYLGSEFDVDFESKLVIGLRTNDVGFIGAPGVYNYEPMWAPPPDANVFVGIDESTIAALWSAEDGTSEGQMMLGRESVNPVWSCAPSAFYGNAAKIFINDRIIVGEHVRPGDYTDTGWYMQNGVIRISLTGTNSRLQLGAWTNSNYTTETFNFQFEDHNNAGTITYSEITANWDFMSILRNDPDAVAVRLALNTAAGKQNRTMDITMRRGMPFAEFSWNVTGGTVTNRRGLQIDTLGSPTMESVSATSPFALRETASGTTFARVLGFNDDVKWNLSAANGYIRTPTANEATSGEFFIGIRSSNPSTWETALNLGRFWHGALAIRTQAVFR